jgi:hypothetical protein
VIIGKMVNIVHLEGIIVIVPYNDGQWYWTGYLKCKKCQRPAESVCPMHYGCTGCGGSEIIRCDYCLG